MSFPHTPRANEVFGRSASAGDPLPVPHVAPGPELLREIGSSQGKPVGSIPKGGPLWFVDCLRAIDGSTNSGMKCVDVSIIKACASLHGLHVQQLQSDTAV